jgi:hypothetical protein
MLEGHPPARKRRYITAFGVAHGIDDGEIVAAIEKGASARVIY